MARLTGRDKGNAYILKCFEGDGCGDMDTTRCDCCEHNFAICDRLAAYEDTGLTPEEVNRLLAQLAESQAREQAAVEDITHDCDTCLYAGYAWDEPPCETCIEGEVLSGIKRTDNWQWRGPEAGKGEAE